ncbi:GTP-binding protein Era [Thiovulum sp. ES]|nr:GTP-binding protein Era [Thiovulum sp. ES]
MTKSGFVALIGRPNAGKSTLLNWLLGEKIAIVSHKANATRKRVNAIVMQGDDQIILIDTPGLHEREKLLNQYMMEEALKAIGDCDIVLYLAPINDPIEDYEKFLKISDRPHILLLTKIDRVSNERILKKIAEYQKYSDKFLELIPISVSKSLNRDSILKSVVKYLPESPYLYNPEDLTTEHIRDIYREFIREAVFDETSAEIPYESDVVIDKIEENTEIERIRATLIVEKQSQKLVVIGNGGKTIKRISVNARKKIESFVGRQIYLEVFVSVKKGWSKNKRSLEDFGYVF